MSENLQVCDIHPELKEIAHRFRMRKEKNIAAKVFKIDRKKCMVILDEEYEDTTIDDVREEIPPQQPRYIALSYVHKRDDGRVQYPLIFIFLSPQGCSPDLQMMYAGTKLSLIKELEFTKVMEFRNADEFTEESILEFLKNLP